MVETITVVGIVISQMSISEYDKRLVLLTKELGKITAFVRGARKPNSPFLAGSQPMAFGEFTLYRGRNSYTVTSIKVTEYFSNTMHDIDSMYMGMYFLELSDYYGREGLDASDTIKLLYVALKALNKNVIPKELVRRIFELRLLVINGEYPDMFSCINCGAKEKLDYFDLRHNGMVCSNCHGNIPERSKVLPSTLYALQYIVTSPFEKLFSFNVKEEVLVQLKNIIGEYMKKRINKKFNSLEFLENSY